MPKTIQMALELRIDEAAHLAELCDGDPMFNELALSLRRTIVNGTDETISRPPPGDGTRDPGA